MDLELSDFDSFSDSDSSIDDLDDVELSYTGHACSILSSLEESISKIDDLLSFEKGFTLGDIVSSAEDPSGQMGKVIDVDITVDLENVHGRKFRDMNSRTLRRIRSVSVGDYVVSSFWLGRVRKIIDRIGVRFDDGSRSEFSASGPEKLIPISPDLLEDPQYPYYPGQRVFVESASASKSTRWLCCASKNTRSRGTVCSVDAGLVYVDWLGCEIVGSEKIPTPPSLQDVKNLTLLPSFSHANWQLGDWCAIHVTDCKRVQERGFLTAPACEIIHGEGKSETRPEFQEIAVITETKTKVNVLWQDGSISLGLDSRSLSSVTVIDAHDFWPEQFVLEKGLCDDSPLPSTKRWGVVKFVDARERTVMVKWSTVSMDQPTVVMSEQTEEIVSAYELVEHPDFDYSVGDVVARLRKIDFAAHSHQEGLRPHSPSQGATGTGEDLNGSSSNDFLPCIGTVIGLKDGEVEIKWATGDTCKVPPNEIYQVDNCEDLSGTATPYNQHIEPSDEDMTLVTESLEQRGKESLGPEAENEECSKKSSTSGSSSFPQSAVGLFTSVASTLFGSISSSLFGGYELHKAEEMALSSNEEEVELGNSHPNGSSLDVGNLEMVQETSSGFNMEEVDGISECAPPHCSKHSNLFRQFDMVNDCSDHQFIDGSGKGEQHCQVDRVWLKKVRQEWSILEKDLPETIYVRAYEERMDLLRAAIIGVEGTPYHDGVFFFDIFLPPQYPHQPPMVYYNSGGLRVNPNLYESGRVCLSLLNTWTGAGSEVWNPEKSTILQVLLSLQALVLNEKPYFNEAGYDSQMGKAEGEKNSVSYNENAFLMSCKSMLYVLRKPPKHFEALVTEHFSQRCKNILAACKAYMDGAPVGFPLVDENAQQETRAEKSSTGFKIILVKLIPKLAEAFSEKGMDYGDI